MCAHHTSYVSLRLSSKHNIHFCYSEARGRSLTNVSFTWSWENNLKAEALVFTEPSTKFHKYSLTRIMGKLQSSSHPVCSSFTSRVIRVAFTHNSGSSRSSTGIHQERDFVTLFTIKEKNMAYEHSPIHKIPWQEATCATSYKGERKTGAAFITSCKSPPLQDKKQIMLTPGMSLLQGHT